jgi:hypothetical protein
VLTSHTVLKKKSASSIKFKSDRRKILNFCQSHASPDQLPEVDGSPQGGDTEDFCL